jgi:hypothetical protein
MIRYYIPLVLALAASLATPLAGLAQTPDQLPDSPAYKGEIRRGADGKLIVRPVDAPPRAAAAKRATMVVGSGEAITTISEAARRARDGEVIDIRPGDYRGQPAIWTQNNLLIRGAGARPVMLADGKSAEGKAIWVVRGGNVRIENVEFRGARVASGNGAGIRFERGHLVVHRCAFFDNEMGILTANFPELTLEVSDSEFAAAPRHEGDLHHLLYVGAIGRFVLSGSRFEQGYRGHLVKSRARENDVRYNLLVDGSDGRASYELEFPNGGIAYVIGNVIGQSAATDNPALVAYGAEGPRWPDNALFLAHNTLLNDLHAGTFLKVWDEKFPAAIETWVINNLTVGYGDLFKPAQGRFEGNKSIARRDLLDYGGLPLRLNGGSALRGSVRPPGNARGVDLLPAAEFSFPVGRRPIHLSSSLAPGAFQ